MNNRIRRDFDRHLAWVLECLPPEVHHKLEEVPLHVEDCPSAEVMEEMGVEFPDELCGYYSGVPLDERNVDQPPVAPDFITLYREGILAVAADDNGHVSDAQLRREIRITILHELGHHHGIDEDELDELGYG
jgi:predicted Zn-dependent protease with MMP-like domain